MDEVRFDDKVAVVTGAGRGIGREKALLLAARAARVLVSAMYRGRAQWQGSNAGYR